MLIVFIKIYVLSKRVNLCKLLQVRRGKAVYNTLISLQWWISMKGLQGFMTSFWEIGAKKKKRNYMAFLFAAMRVRGSVPQNQTSGCLTSYVILISLHNGAISVNASLTEPHINPCYQYISHPSLKLKSEPWWVSSRDLLFLCQNPPYFCFLSSLPVLLLWLQQSNQISEQAAFILHKVTTPFSHQDLILRFMSWVKLIKVNIKIKIIIIIILKFNSRIEPGLGQGYEWGWPLTQVDTITKIIIIIVFKPDLKIDSGMARVRCEEGKSGLT